MRHVRTTRAGNPSRKTGVGRARSIVRSGTDHVAAAASPGARVGWRREKGTEAKCVGKILTRRGFARTRANAVPAAAAKPINGRVNKSREALRKARIFGGSGRLLRARTICGAPAASLVFAGRRLAANAWSRRGAPCIGACCACQARGAQGASSVLCNCIYLGRVSSFGPTR